MKSKDEILDGCQGCKWLNYYLTGETEHFDDDPPCDICRETMDEEASDLYLSEKRS